MRALRRPWHPTASKTALRPPPENGPDEDRVLHCRRAAPLCGAGRKPAAGGASSFTETQQTATGETPYLRREVRRVVIEEGADAAGAALCIVRRSASGKNADRRTLRAPLQCPLRAVGVAARCCDTTLRGVFLDKRERACFNPMTTAAKTTKEGSLRLTSKHRTGGRGMTVRRDDASERTLSFWHGSCGGHVHSSTARDADSSVPLEGTPIARRRGRARSADPSAGNPWPASASG